MPRPTVHTVIIPLLHKKCLNDSMSLIQKETHTDNLLYKRKKVEAYILLHEKDSETQIYQQKKRPNQHTAIFLIN